MAAVAERICAFSGCGKVHYARGFCAGHYQQQNKGQGLRPLQQKAAGMICMFGDCGLPCIARGFCTGHFQQQNKGQGLRPLKKRPTPGQVCSYDPCGRPAKSRGLCSGHYQQQQSGRELRPLREVVQSGWLGCGVDERCGSYRGYQSALRAGDRPCMACRAANTAVTMAELTTEAGAVRAARYRASDRGREIARQQSQRRHAMKRGTTIGDPITPEMLAGKLEMQGGRCYYCDESLTGEIHQDHWLPLAVKGPHCLANLKPACPSCNLHKHARHPVWEWPSESVYECSQGATVRGGQWKERTGWVPAVMLAAFFAAEEPVEALAA